MNKTPFLSSNAAGPDAVSPTSHDAQQQHLLKRHSSPGSFSTLRTRGQHTMPGDRPLLSHPSVIPGPSYPFPSQTPLARPHGFLHSLLKPFKRYDTDMLLAVRISFTICLAALLGYALSVHIVQTQHKQHCSACSSARQAQHMLIIQAAVEC